MGVRAKILVGFSVVFAIGMILGLFGLYATSSLTSLSDQQYEIQIAGDSVTSVLNAHYEWRQTLMDAVLNMSAFTGSLDPATCALGKWKNSDEAKAVSDPEIISLLKQLDSPHDYIHNEAKNVVASIEAGDREEATRIATENILPRTKEAISILGAMETRYNEMASEKGGEAVDLGNLMRFMIIALIVVALVASVLLALLITASIMKPISNMAKSALTISTGDLEVHIDHNANDEIGQLADAFQTMLNSTKEQVAVAQKIAEGDLTVTVAPRSDKDVMNIAFNRMLDNLNNMFGNIYASTTQVSAGSKQIADGAQSLAQGSTQQAAAVEELSSSITEIADKTKENADMAEKAARLSITIKQNAEKGSRQMDEMMNAVTEISEASQSINKVIKVIDDIAFQTNILALNAAVEAARAGQHGKGFAVVAEEVRNLAAKSAEAAKDTGGLIANSMEKAELGARIAGETAASLTDIVSGINESSQLVGDIARSSEEQSSGITQINRGIDQVAQVVQQNSATAEESAAASQEMSGQANILEELIAQFKLKNGGNQSAQYLPRTTPGAGNAGAAEQHFGKY